MMRIDVGTTNDEFAVIIVPRADPSPRILILSSRIWPNKRGVGRVLLVITTRTGGLERLVEVNGGLKEAKIH